MVDVDSNSEGHALVTGQYSNDHVQVPFTKVDNLQTDFVGPKMGLMDIPITFAIESTLPNRSCVEASQIITPFQSSSIPNSGVSNLLNGLIVGLRINFFERIL
ncbi:hypothetical protein V6N13_063703 [Hibiscus sabdariffa]